MHDETTLNFQSLFESLPGNYLILNPQLKILAVSDAYLHATQTKRDELLGQSFLDLFPESLDEASSTELNHLVFSLNRVRKTHTADKLTLQKYSLLDRKSQADENIFWSLLNTPVFGERQELKYIIHSVEDCSDLNHIRPFRIERSSKPLSQELDVSELSLDLEALHQELDTFSYSISHDFRSPLLTVEAFAQALYDDHNAALDADAKGYLTLIRSELQQLRQLTEDLITFARVRTVDLHLQTINLSQIVEEIMASLSHRDPQRQVEFQLEASLMVCADLSLLQIGLQKLLDNAWKFSRKEAVTNISFGSLQKEGGIEYFVRDNGAGFDMIHSQNLFGAFQRLHDHREFEGVGIGLAIVQRIIHRHDGSIRAEAAPQQGATFYFRLGKTDCAASSNIAEQ